MTTVQLFHNPGAGDGEHSRKKLVALIEDHGYKCIYTSTKDKAWKDSLDEHADIMAVAGGDGTVRKLVKELMKRTLMDKKYPIAVLPMGTANNIGRSLGISGETEEIIAGWEQCRLQRYDIGRVTGLDDAIPFLESFGFGAFPNHMNAMKKMEPGDITPEEKLDMALQQMQDVAANYEARKCKLTIDGIDHSGKFLMIEVMNIRSIGPNLDLNPHADPSDGEMEVILVGEEQREQLTRYIENKNDEQFRPGFSTLKAKKIEMTWNGIHAHADDEVIKKDKSATVTMEILAGVLEFLVPAASA